MSLRVIGAGLGRTGTNSLMTALDMILPGSCHHMYKVVVNDESAKWRDIYRGDMALLHETMANYVASCDWPSCVFWEELAEANPDALILLSVRESGEKWFESASATIFPGMQERRNGAWGEMVVEMMNRFEPDFMNKDKAIAAYEAHNANVRAKADPSRLLEWQASDGWGPICERLGVPVPDVDFPHTNTTDDFRKMWRMDG